MQLYSKGFNLFGGFWHSFFLLPAIYLVFSLMRQTKSGNQFCRLELDFIELGYLCFAFTPSYKPLNQGETSLSIILTIYPFPGTQGMLLPLFLYWLLNIPLKAISMCLSVSMYQVPARSLPGEIYMYSP